MEIMEQHTFQQSSGTRITLRRTESDFYPYYSPYSAERLVDRFRQEGRYGIDLEQAKKTMKDWIAFEKSIKSVEL